MEILQNIVIGFGFKLDEEQTQYMGDILREEEQKPYYEKVLAEWQEKYPDIDVWDDDLFRERVLRDKITFEACEDRARLLREREQLVSFGREVMSDEAIESKIVARINFRVTRAMEEELYPCEYLEDRMKQLYNLTVHQLGNTVLITTSTYFTCAGVDYCTEIDMERWRKDMKTGSEVMEDIIEKYELEVKTGYHILESWE
jgi:hypothetical protein